MVDSVEGSEEEKTRESLELLKVHFMVMIRMLTVIWSV
jgi:hypothetical protein